MHRTYQRDKLESVGSDRGGTYAYAYDEIGRVKKRTWKFASRAFVTEYHYDAHGCLDTITYPTGTVLTIHCDAKGRAVRLERTSSPAALLARDIEYSAAGGISKITYGSGATVERKIEKGRLTRISAPTYLDVSYTYDGADNITSITDRIDGSNSVPLIEYDRQNRLWKYAGTEYKYDSLGNLRQESVGNGAVNYAYDGATNRLKSVSGNLGLPGSSLAWSPDGSLTSFVAKECTGICLFLHWLGSPTVPQYVPALTSYQYDAFSRRVVKNTPLVSVPGSDPRYQTTLYHYDESGRLLAETDREGKVLREYYYAADLLVSGQACAAGTARPCDKVWFFTDLVGSVAARQVEGQGVERSSYEPFGGRSAGSGQKAFLAHLFDEESQLYDLGSRLYAPGLRRFVSADRGPFHADDPQKANSYAYARNNPLQYTDADGRSPTLILAGVGAVVGGAWAAYSYRNLNGTNYAAKVAEGAFIGGIFGLTLGLAAPIAVEVVSMTAAGGVNGFSTAVAIHGWPLAAALVPEAGFGYGIMAAEERLAAAAAVQVEQSAAKAATQLSRESLRGIRSLEKQIAAHEQKLANFIANPTVRPGMEHLPKEVIDRQQQSRIQHFEKEIRTFKENIQKILNGGQ